MPVPVPVLDRLCVCLGLPQLCYQQNIRADSIKWVSCSHKTIFCSDNAVGVTIMITIYWNTERQCTLSTRCAINSCKIPFVKQTLEKIQLKMCPLQLGNISVYDLGVYDLGSQGNLCLYHLLWPSLCWCPVCSGRLKVEHSNGCREICWTYQWVEGIQKLIDEEHPLWSNPSTKFCALSKADFIFIPQIIIIPSQALSVPPRADVNLDYILIHFDTTTAMIKLSETRRWYWRASWVLSEAPLVVSSHKLFHPHSSVGWDILLPWQVPHCPLVKDLLSEE